MYLHEGHEKVAERVQEYLPLLLRQANVKHVQFVPTGVALGGGVAFAFGSVVLDLAVTKALEEEGFAREIMRRVQALRKDAGLQKDDRIFLVLHVQDIDLSHWSGQIAERCGAKEVHLDVHHRKFHSHSEGDIKGKKFMIGFDRV